MANMDDFTAITGTMVFVSLKFHESFGCRYISIGNCVLDFIKMAISKSAKR